MEYLLAASLLSGIFYAVKPPPPPRYIAVTQEVDGVKITKNLTEKECKADSVCRKVLEVK